MKLSKIENMNNRTLVIKAGKQQWIEPQIKINFKLPSVQLLEELNNKVFTKLKDTDTNLHMVYVILPILTDIEIDKDEEWFDQQFKDGNYGAIMIFKAVLEQAQENISYVNEVLKIAEQNQKLQQKSLNTAEKIKNNVSIEI